MAHHDVTFPENYSRGMVGGPRFSTTVVVGGDGFEQRNINWALARGVWNLSRVFEDPEKRDAAIAFFVARRGKAHSFLFKDWADFFVGMEYVGYELTHSEAHVFATGNGSKTQFQLLKVYERGSYQYERKITRPHSPIKIYRGGVEVSSGVSVNYSTGVVTFSVAPSNGVEIGWSGEFRVPVRFDFDELNLDLLAPTTGRIEYNVAEVRE